MWNARILPFYYLCIYLLAAWAARRRVVVLDRAAGGRGPDPPVFGVSVAAIGVVGRHRARVRRRPLQSLRASPTKASTAPSQYYVGPVRGHDRLGPGESWAKWNFTGYEGKAAYPEYHGVDRRR